MSWDKCIIDWDNLLNSGLSARRGNGHGITIKLKSSEILPMAYYMQISTSEDDFTTYTGGFV